MQKRFFICSGLAALIVTAVLGPAKAQEGSAGPMRPHAGLVLTTAFTNAYGPDAESSFTFNSVTADAIDIGYSSSRGVSTARRILVRDRQSSNVYVIGFANSMPPEIPGSTSLGLSSAALMELRSTGQTSLSLAYDAGLNQIAGVLTLVEQNIKMPLLIENTLVPAPAIHLRGQFGKGKKAAVADFYILDNKSNPLMLQSTIKFSWEKTTRTEKIIRVAAGQSMQGEMEQTLAALRAYDTYGIHFAFDKDTIRKTSASVISEIATTLRNNPTWSLQINGYTDAIGDPDYNQNLSARRAAAVKAALVRSGIAAARLQTAGYGSERPKGNNDTLQGRALNRRVELVRTDR
jgi:outer membrane protein OmpA-like peptidoglycan-associated protein